MTVERPAAIRTGGVSLEGSLTLPAPLTGVVLFAHGSGSSRHSPRNRHVAQALQEAGLGTLLVDLLTAEEEEVDRRTRHLRFDIGLLGERLNGIVDWLDRQPDTARIPIGLFGASTGAAGALIAAADRPEAVAAVVSRGGRPDLAASKLTEVQAATLLIVGGRDTDVLALNRAALQQLGSESKRLEIVSGASHLFEEEGALERVTTIARDWFLQHLAL